MRIPAGLIEWTCTCGNVNTAKQGACVKCGRLLPEAARIFRTGRVLTPEEENFYKRDVPVIIGELRQCNELLRKIAKKEE